MITKQLHTTRFIFIFLFSTLIASHTYAQNEPTVTVNDIKSKYDEWLRDATLDTLFYVKNIEHIEGFYNLTLFGKLADVKILSTVWKSIEDSLKGVQVDPAEILLYQFSKAASRPKSKCRVIIESKNLNVFGGVLSYQDGSFRSTLEYITQRGANFDLGVVISEILGNPHGQLQPFAGTLADYKDKLKKNLSAFLKSKKVSWKKVEEIEKNDSFVMYKVSDIKRVITSKFHEIIAFEFTFYELNEVVVASYELIGSYASGFNTPGEFRDMKKNYYKELVKFQQEFVEKYTPK